MLQHHWVALFFRNVLQKNLLPLALLFQTLLCPALRFIFFRITWCDGSGDDIPALETKINFLKNVPQLTYYYDYRSQKFTDYCKWGRYTKYIHQRDIVAINRLAQANKCTLRLAFWMLLSKEDMRGTNHSQQTNYFTWSVMRHLRVF